MSSSDHIFYSPESKAQLSKLVDDALGKDSELKNKKGQYAAQVVLEMMLPLQAPEGMAFVVKPNMPHFALLIHWIRAEDRRSKNIMISSKSVLKDIEISEYETVYRDPENDNLPVFEGTRLDRDHEILGRFAVTNADGRVRVLCNPKLNHTELINLDTK